MRRDALAIVLMAIVTLAVTSASEFVLADSRSESQPRTSVVSVYFLDATGKPSPPKTIPRELMIQLGAMSGKFGGVGDVTVQTIRVGREMLFQLDLPGLTAKLGAAAARSKEGDSAPLGLSPDSVKFSRTSTSALSGTDPLSGLAAVFWDLEANGSLVPVFFDRPCQVHPRLMANRAPIDIPSAGLAWMMSKKDENERFVLTLAINPRPAIIIAPPEAFDRISKETLMGLN